MIGPKGPDTPDTPNAPNTPDNPDTPDPAQQCTSMVTVKEPPTAADSPRQQAPTLDISVRTVKPTVPRQCPDRRQRLTGPGTAVVRSI